jgi:hypothetical protein
MDLEAHQCFEINGFSGEILNPLISKHWWASKSIDLKALVGF